MQHVMEKLGLHVMKTKNVGPFDAKDKGITIQDGMSIFIFGDRSMLVFGRINKVLVKGKRSLKAIKAHFDGKYDVMLHGEGTVAHQLVRWSYGDDFDSLSEFAVMWAPRYTRGELANLLAYDWEGGCSCSHDCCGHWFTNVWGHKAKKFGPLHIVFFGHYRNV